LRNVISRKTSYSSKQILIPFFQNTDFELLEIRCEHIPKWFEKELPKLNLALRSEQYQSCMKVFVTPRC
ncbi:MAG: Fe-only nitrogenase accessory AnfO family protein, partial [Oscillospiraceae bacterium]